jgi:glycerol-3-phosphate acyltransferase PlsX
MRVALDAMGGDFAPSATVKGALDAVSENEDIEVILVGDESAIKAELRGKSHPHSKIRILHASEVISMDESPSFALRRKKDSSIRKAVMLVKSGEADAVVSAGHSGGAMALAFFLLGPAKGVDRPAIAAVMPSYRKPFVLIDAGANVDCNPGNLLQFALMGSSYARHILDRTDPKVALLSIGEEATKGNELTKEAFKLLGKAEGINFTGNMEGKDIFMGNADVVVCDGFTGNVFLKTSEGLAEVVMKMLKREIKNILTGRFGYLLIKPALMEFKRKTDYDEYGGAPLLGINGTCIISHGRSTPKAVKNAIKVASEFSRKRVFEIISKGLSRIKAVESVVAAG